MSGRVQNKACIVTGAGSGIGKATALRLAEEGGKVVVSDINLDSAQKVVDEIKTKGQIAIAAKTDVSS
ncbi:MAG: SDR family NAD(P)-dependent oxidoreductase, partial [Actinomycetes bacterium]